MAKVRDAAYCRKGLYLCALIALSGCDIFDPTKCILIAVPGIQVVARDVVSGEVVESREFVAIATDGAYADTLTALKDPLASSARVNLVYERPGRYRVDLMVEGYARWVKADVRVGRTSDGCHVKTEFLTAHIRAM